MSYVRRLKMQLRKQREVHRASLLLHGILVVAYGVITSVEVVWLSTDQRNPLAYMFLSANVVIATWTAWQWNNTHHLIELIDETLEALA